MNHLFVIVLFVFFALVIESAQSAWRNVPLPLIYAGLSNHKWQYRRSIFKFGRNPRGTPYPIDDEVMKLIQSRKRNDDIRVGMSARVVVR